MTAGEDGGGLRAAVSVSAATGTLLVGFRSRKDSAGV